MNSDSVIPMRARHANNIKAEVEKPVSAVTPLHRIKLITTRTRFEKRSPTWPAIGEQNAAAGEMSRNIGQAAAGTATVARSIAGTAHATVQTTRSAELVLAAARGLSSDTAELRSSVDRFLANVAA